MDKEIDLELHYDEGKVKKSFLKEFHKLAKKFQYLICTTTEDDVATDCFWVI